VSAAPQPQQPPTLAEASRRPASFGQTMAAVFWSFFGVRRSRDLAHDVQRLNPVHLVLGGLVGAAIFVVSLLLIVRWVVLSGVAA